MKVEIRSYLRDHQNGEIDETWTLDEQGSAVCDDASEQRRFEKVGAVGDHGHIYYPQDGIPFLRSLPDQYANSSFVRAKIIE
ncbi:hypothetical protein [Prosthecobacter fluviatilis]|uniref:Uncharacterized protein n=1 Tax=Prosthecobacter fluviatilis TaxID=445931 RepID=A0ABW0KV18_9BACT